MAMGAEKDKFRHAGNSHDRQLSDQYFGGTNFSQQPKGDLQFFIYNEAPSKTLEGSDNESTPSIHPTLMR